MVRQWLYDSDWFHHAQGRAGRTLGTVQMGRIPGLAWGYSSVGRARRSQCRGRGFESLYLHQSALVAQRIERRRPKSRVGGSNPSKGTINIWCGYGSKIAANTGAASKEHQTSQERSSVWPERWSPKPVAGGSNPPAPANESGTKKPRTLDPRAFSLSATTQFFIQTLVPVGTEQIARGVQQ